MIRILSILLKYGNSEKRNFVFLKLYLDLDENAENIT